MSVARYIELCDRLKDTPDGPEYDRLTGELDTLYQSMTAHEIAAVESHFAAREDG